MTLLLTRKKCTILTCESSLSLTFMTVATLKLVTAGDGAKSAENVRLRSENYNQISQLQLNVSFI